MGGTGVTWLFGVLWLLLLLVLVGALVLGGYFLFVRRGSTISGTDRAIATLRERYARGEVDDEEFERRYERLMGGENRPGGGDRT